MLSFRTGISKNKKTSINEVTYRNNHISIFHDSTLPNVLSFRFYLFDCNRKEKDHVSNKINSKNNDA